MMGFTLMIQWRTSSATNEASNPLYDLSLPDIIERLQDIQDTAGADLIENIIIARENQTFALGKGFRFDLGGNVTVGDLHK